MLPKKTVLKVTPCVPASKNPKPKKNEYLRECFQTIIDRELLHMNIKKVNDILINDVHVNLKSLPYRLQCVLAECLCNYMKVWPGWAKYDQHCSTEKTKRDYFEKFRQYLSFKMNYIIKNEKLFWNDPPPDVTKDENKVSREVQTDPVSKSHKPEAPYNLVISGQPNVLNNIVFIEVENNIVIKQHAEKPWKTLTTPEFLNYSFVYVEVTLPDIHLSRSNLHEFQRYITECGDTATCPDVDFITYIRKTNRNAESKVYTFNFLSAYFAQFLEVMQQVPGIDKTRLSELEDIFKEFLIDIQATNLHGMTMATSTSVCFNIGGNRYIRNKKMVVNSETKRDTNAINFCEILIPRTSYTLYEFTAVEDPSTEYASFKSLNEILCLIKKGKTSDFYPITETINNCISYQCILCPKIYQGAHAYVEILDHFRFLHKGEQSVLCFKCRKQFEVPKLSGNRWAHVCEPKVSCAAASTTASTDIPGSVVAATTSTVTTTTMSATTPVMAVIAAPNNAVGTLVCTNNTALSNSSSSIMGNAQVSAPVINNNIETCARIVVETPTSAVAYLPTATVMTTPSSTVNNLTSVASNTIVGIPTYNIVGVPTSAIVSTVPDNIIVANPVSTSVNPLGGILLQTPVITMSTPIASNNSIVAVASSSNIMGTTNTTKPNITAVVSDVRVTSSVASFVATTSAITSTDLFADFNVDSITNGIADGLSAAPIDDLISEAPPSVDADATTAINIASIMEHIGF